MNKYRVFNVPSDDEILIETGLQAEQFGSEPTVRAVRQRLGADQLIVFSYDVSGRSIRCRWTSGDGVVVDIFREGAVALKFESGNGRTMAITTFETDSLAGDLRLQLYPTFAAEDAMLIC